MKAGGGGGGGGGGESRVNWGIDKHLSSSQTCNAIILHFLKVLSIWERFIVKVL